MHDLHDIALVQCMLGMPSARHDFAIDLHSNATLCKAFLVQQRGQRQVVGQRTQLPLS